MIRYVPSFILYNLERGKLHGSFPGFVLYFDLADFTRTCDILQKEGKRGAEEISKLLQTLLHEPLSQIKMYGGYIISFGGGSFLAVFRESAAQNVLLASYSIRDYFLKNNSYVSPFGSFPLKIRLLVSFGKISWRIFESELQNEYLFRGTVILQRNKLLKRQTGLIFTEEAVLRVGGLRFANVWRNSDIELSAMPFKLPNQNYNHSATTADLFLHHRYRNLVPENEIRQVVCCMINLERIRFERRTETISTIQVLAHKYGGFVNKLVYNDKGIEAVVLFGMPRNEGETQIKACGFADEAVRSEPFLAFGISCGNVFAGFVGSETTCEYTALGHPVNIAASIVELARPGEIICTQSILKEAGKVYAFELHSSCPLMGVSSITRIYKLIKKLAGYNQPSPARFIGRDKQVKWLRNEITKTYEDGRNKAIYIKGEPGIGKTRLVREALRRFYNNKYYIVQMSCDLLVPKPLQADARFIRSFYGLKKEEMNPAGFPVFHKKWTIWAGDNQELLELEPMLAAYLNLMSMAVLKRDHPQWLKPENQVSGWLTLLRELATRRRLLLFIDDIQRIDYMSLEYLVHMAKAGIEPVCILLSYTPDEKRETIDLNLENYTTHVLDVNPLSVENSLLLYEHLLGVSELPPNTYNTLKENTRGNPHKIQQVASLMIVSGWSVASDVVFTGPDVSSNLVVNEIGGQYIDNLPKRSRKCLLYASVLGIRFDSRVLTAMLGYFPEDDLLLGVKDKIWKHIGEGIYEFAHQITQQVVYQRMLSDKLAQLHLKAAVALEELFSEKPEQHSDEINLHYQKADDLAQVAIEESKSFNHSSS